MGKLLYLGIMLASLDPEYERAGDQARRALLQTEMMKLELHELEIRAKDELYQYTGLQTEDLIYAAYAMPVLTGKLSTKPFKNFKYENSGYIVRPDFEYDLYNKKTSTILVLTKEF